MYRDVVIKVHKNTRQKDLQNLKEHPYLGSYEIVLDVCLMIRNLQKEQEGNVQTVGDLKEIHHSACCFSVLP